MKCVRCGEAIPTGAAACHHCSRPAVAERSMRPVNKSQERREKGARSVFSTGVPVQLDITRRLCIAVQADATLASMVVNLILKARFRALPPSPSFDLVPVVKHAIAAKRRNLMRNLLMAAAVIALLVIWITGFIARPHALLVVLEIIGFTWIVVFGELLYTYMVVMPRLGRGKFNPDEAPVPRSAAQRKRLASIVARVNGNVVVFSGYSPFVGHGFAIDGWSFALNLKKSEKGGPAKQFGVDELYEYVASAVRGLRLSGATVENKLFVNGLDLQGETSSHIKKALLPKELGPPAAHADEYLLKRLRLEPAHRARSYIAVHVPSWDGELVVSSFLRFVLHEGSLFIEMSKHLLTPFKKRYRRVERRAQASGVKRFFILAAMATYSFIVVPLDLLGRAVIGIFAPQSVVPEPGDARAAAEIGAREFDYGARWSPREAVADNRYRQYFQKLDNEMYMQVVEARVIDAVADFLSDRNYDVSELRRRQATILNNGIYVTGQARINAQSIAGGTAALAKVVRPSGRAGAR